MMHRRRVNRTKRQPRNPKKVKKIHSNQAEALAEQDINRLLGRLQLGFVDTMMRTPRNATESALSSHWRKA